ncbi:Uncharacterised protein [Vibrio cholerae]|nr:Uncharacterised protein [Vibrio cholerae]CSI60694.1 Uncharacterised protein [Vibrio cholerae]
MLSQDLGRNRNASGQYGITVVIRIRLQGKACDRRQCGATVLNRTNKTIVGEMLDIDGLL